MTIVPVANSTRSPRRPFGLNAIIVLQLLTVLFSGLALVVLGVAIWAAAAGAEMELAVDGEVGKVGQVSGLLLLVFTLVINLLCAVGLWRRQRWAWFLTMLQLGFFMLEDLYTYFTGASSEEYAWSMLLNVLMVFYLNQREVQAVFMRKGSNESNRNESNPSESNRSGAPAHDQGGAPQ